MPGFAQVKQMLTCDWETNSLSLRRFVKQLSSDNPPLRLEVLFLLARQERQLRLFQDAEPDSCRLLEDRMCDNDVAMEFVEEMEYEFLFGTDSDTGDVEMQDARHGRAVNRGCFQK